MHGIRSFYISSSGKRDLLHRRHQLHSVVRTSYILVSLNRAWFASGNHIPNAKMACSTLDWTSRSFDMALVRGVNLGLKRVG